MTLVREFNLYLNAGKSIPLVINVNQYDYGEQWVFTLYSDNGTQYTPSSGAIVGIKSDNLGIINTATVDGQGRVVVNETQQMTAAVGKATFELLIDGQTHGTANFFVLVEPKPGDNADLSESDYSLFQEAINGTSATAIAEGVATWMDENLTPTTPVVDASLTVQGAAADAKKTGDEISDLKSLIARGGLSDDIKQALLFIASNVTWAGNNPTGQTYINALEEVLYPSATITRISCVYTQSGIVFTSDSLDSLKQDLVVTAHYSDGTTTNVVLYTLSGTLTVGTSTVTVTYSGKTTTFNVTVSVAPLYPLAVGTHPITVNDNTVGTMTISSGEYTHVKLEFTSNAVIPSGGTNPYYFIRLNEGDCGRASLINNNAQWFNIPANVEGTLELANVVNASSIVFAMNFRKANATSSSSFGIADGTHTEGATKTVTLSTAESAGNLFWYTGENKTIPANTVVEFDVKFTLGGERYF